MGKIMRNMKDDISNKWMDSVNKYLRKLGMSREDVGIMEKKEIKDKIKEYDSEMWKSKLRIKKLAKRYY